MRISASLDMCRKLDDGEPSDDHGRTMFDIDVIDSHTGGEPTRVVVGGFPDLGNGPLSERRERLRSQYDRYRRAVIGEPRSADHAVGAVLVPAHDPGACAGVIFFNNVGYLGMCGHGMIGVIATLVHLGRIAPGQHRLDTPVGTVGVILHEDGQVTVRNVESWRHAAGVSVEVPGYGTVTGDVAWSGNWFFLTADSPAELYPRNLDALTAFTAAVRTALETAGITGADGAVIDHIEIHGASPNAGLDGRNFVLCPGMEWDRSPCGTGTSAKLACLAADDALSPGEIWHQESLIGSVFEASYRRSINGRVLPSITGRAAIVGESRLLFDPTDPFAWGIGR